MSGLSTCHGARFAHCRGLCKSCYDAWLCATNPGYKSRQRANSSAWSARNPEKKKAAYEARKLRQRDDPVYKAKRRQWALTYKYGLTLDAYDELLRWQKGACAICRRLPGKTPLHVDHNHETGKIRGLLCHQCNWYLGTIDKDPAILGRINIYRGSF